jgi:hypothetical protein
MMRGAAYILALSLALLILPGNQRVYAQGPAFANNGKAAAVIAVSKDASAAERYAASQLALHLQQATGANFEVVDPAMAHDNAVIAVGPGAAHAIDPSLDLSAQSLGAEGILQRSVRGNLILTGGQGSARGTIYAVFTFLEDAVGFRWWGPGETLVPKRSVLNVPELNVRSVPTLEYREIHSRGMFDVDTAIRNKINGNSTAIPSDKGGHIVYAGPYFVHTFGLLAPHKELFPSHPEWFAEVDGKRIAPPDNAQLCLSNPELLVYVKGKVREIAKSVPSSVAAIISVSQDDHQVRCQCSRCMAIESEEGSPSGPVLRFVNAIADDVAKDYPNISIDTLAYQYTRTAPKNTKPRPNVIVRLCSFECSFAQPYSDPVNSAFASDVQAWSKICSRLYVWDYVTNFRNYVHPHPNLYALGPNNRFFVEHGVKGLFEQGNRHSPGGDFAVLKNWVLAKLLWNPSLDGRALVDQFVREYYEDAAPEVARYIELVQSASSKTFVGVSDSVLSSYLSPELMSNGLAILEKARQKVEHRPEILARVELIEASMLHAIVTGWPVRKQQSLMRGAKWPLTEPYDSYIDRLSRIVRDQKITARSEGEVNFDWDAWFKKLRTAETGVEAKQPAEVANLPRSAWFDLQDGGFTLYGEESGQASRVSDTSASDQSAVVMPGNHVAWAVQATLTELEGSKKWTLYAAVRIERSSSDGVAFRFGVWDLSAGHVIPATVVENNAIKDSGYHLYRLGAVDLTSTSYVWLAPADNPAVSKIYVDRILFVKGDTQLPASR